MYKLLDYEIERLVEEDVPYLDLTSHLLGIDNQMSTLTIFSREKGIVCGTEEVMRIFMKFNIEVLEYLESGKLIHSKDKIIVGRGRAEDLHQAWKISQNILDYCSGIATKTYRLLQEARVNNPRLMILTTRKSFPGTRKLTAKAIVAGGALPHRLNISETVLVFKNHLNIIGGVEGFIRKLPEIKNAACEKKVLIETSDLGEARKLAEAGVHGIQLDKVVFDDVKEKISEIRKEYPKLVILVAGGINEDNIASYSDPNIDGIITSSLYHAKPLDMGSKIEKYSE